MISPESVHVMEMPPPNFSCPGLLRVPSVTHLTFRKLILDAGAKVVKPGMKNVMRSITLDSIVMNTIMFVFNSYTTAP
jgi:hypothetical protein